LLPDKETRVQLNSLIKQYEEAVDNAISFRAKIMEIVNNQNYDDEHMKEKIMMRLIDANPKIRSSVD
jgi:hypothetical protein